MIKIVVFLIIAATISGCNNIEKQTHKALLATEKSFMEEECRLNSLFIEEPEFQSFQKTEFCSGDLEITQLESISDSESIVDYKITFKAKQRKLKKWLRAYDEMAIRKPLHQHNNKLKPL